MNRKIILGGIAQLAAVAILSFGVAAGASAEEKGDFRTYTVRFAELDISKPEGAKVLYKRLQRAAFIVCDNTNSAAPYARASVARSECYRTALSNAVAQINSPALTALHEGKQGTRVASR